MLDSAVVEIDQPPSYSSPYVGPRPFSQRDSARFFGRDVEASEIVSLVLAYPTLVLYSQSGAGKSSLISAKIIQLLQSKGALVLGPARVQGKPRRSTPNVFVGNVLTNLGLMLKDDDEISFESLMQLVGERQGPSILILDQLEEIFTYEAARWAERQAFFEQLGS